MPTCKLIYPISIRRCIKLFQVEPVQELTDTILKRKEIQLRFINIIFGTRDKLINCNKNCDYNFSQ